MNRIPQDREISFGAAAFLLTVVTVVIAGLSVMLVKPIADAFEHPGFVVHTVPVVLPVTVSGAPKRILSPYIPPEFDGCDLEHVRCHGSRMQELDGSGSELVISCTCKEAR